MNKLSTFSALFTASLITIAAQSAWSDEATPNGSAAPAVQPPVPMAAPAPGWYPPPPNRRGYAQPWQQPPHWAVPPQGYGQLPPRYPARGQSQPVPATPAVAENPLSAELKQTQEQLTASRTELDQTRATLEQLQGKLQHSLEAEQALNENVAAITSEREAMQARVAELNAELDTTTATLGQNRQQIANDQQQTLTLTAERDRLHDELANRDEQLATLNNELQTAREASQQAKSETTTSAEELNAARIQAETFNYELTELKAQLENQESTRLDTEQTLSGERDRLRSDLADRDEQLATLNKELQTARETLQQAKSETTTSAEDLNEARIQAETSNNELSELKAQLENQESACLNASQTLSGERDRLRSDLADRDEQLATLNKELQTAREALQQAKSETTTSAEELTQAPAALTTAQSEMAAGETLEVDAVEVAALQIAGPDADQDGVADSIDLCLETQQGIAVESTGCAADVAIKLEGVNFGYNSHELTEEAQRILDRVADILSQNTDLHLQVAGHTDAQGDPAYNQWLSLQRAQAVRDYLVAQGVDSAHIGAAGYGGEQPIADNTTKEGLRMNRRVELRKAQ